MNFIGLNKCGDTYVHNNAVYHGVYELTLPDGNIAYLRIFGDTRQPVTCSSGGVVEVMQEYVDGKLFTCLMNWSHVEYLGYTQVNGISYPPTPRAISYDETKHLWVLNTHIPTDNALFKWRIDVPMENQWTFDWFNGVIPATWFKKKEEEQV